jgi:STIP1 homology and U-box containing protein 1
LPVSRCHYAIAAPSTAKELAKENKSKRDLAKDIEKAYYRTRKLIYLRENDTRLRMHRDMMNGVMKILHKHTSSNPNDGSLLHVYQLGNMLEAKESELQDVNGGKQEAPEALTCKITYCVMLDPVVTPSGISYERDAIETHLKQNGDFDPVTRQPCRVEELRTNVALREMCHEYLRANPWAFE